jgi:DNA-binding winged helix-turn-helix (wHTH) protein
MARDRYRFDRFTLDVTNRRLWLGAEPVELTARYLDALILLVREQGTLVTKERFLQDVWGGTPVTDEALTQCIKTLRRQLGDSATSPRLIETVPKHGYRFIAPVETAEPVDDESEAAEVRGPAGQGWFSWQQLLLLGGAGMIGGGVAGTIGGLFFGLAGAAQSPQDGLGAFSVLFVLVSINVPLGMLAGAGIGAGISLAGGLPGPPWLRNALGGACGGLLVGGLVKLLGTDAFRLLLGRAPGDMTGGGEGLLLGAAVGLGLWLTSRRAGQPLSYSLGTAALVAGAAGIVIPLLGGRLMGGSLGLLAEAFPQSLLQLQPITGPFRDSRLGLLSLVADTGLEAALFGACVVGALLSACRHRERSLTALAAGLDSTRKAG